MSKEVSEQEEKEAQTKDKHREQHESQEGIMQCSCFLKDEGDLCVS